MQKLDFNSHDWQTSLKNAVTEPAELVRLLQLPDSLIEPARRASELFPLRVPREFIDRMTLGDPDDPLLKQVLPIGDELRDVPDFTDDPLNESASRPVPGVVHKYQDRALMILSGACAVNCRYCFRRHFPYQENQISGSNWKQALEYIQDHSDVHEVIFSGGDPLVTPDQRLEKLIIDLESLPQIERLRIHTRLPVVIPSRITAQLVDILSNSRLNLVMVFHINHEREIDRSLEAAIQPLRKAGITLLNQAVLLKSINDSADEQIKLSRKLFQIGVLPYYLFLFDPVKGASHFDIPEDQAKKIAEIMQRSLPGYLMPRLAKEIPGRPSKTLVLPDGNFLA